MIRHSRQDSGMLSMILSSTCSFSPLSCFVRFAFRCVSTNPISFDFPALSSNSLHIILYKSTIAMPSSKFFIKLVQTRFVLTHCLSGLRLDLNLWPFRMADASVSGSVRVGELRTKPVQQLRLRAHPSDSFRLSGYYSSVKASPVTVRGKICMVPIIAQVILRVTGPGSSRGSRRK